MAYSTPILAGKKAAQWGCRRMPQLHFGWIFLKIVSVMIGCLHDQEEMNK
jgi:hypothetical protein